MHTGYCGTFVISWTQIEIDGLRPAPLEALGPGASWRWTGRALRLDGPQDVLLLAGDREAAALRRHAARAARRLLGAGPAALPEDEADAPEALPERGFHLTDGRHSYAARLIEPVEGGAPLVAFEGALPAAGAELWVVRGAPAQPMRPDAAALAGGVICFAIGTRIATPEGPRAIESLQPGARILTKDDGPQEVLWSASRRMSGARLVALPQLRPIRLRAGALGIDRPDGDLLVSPQHRMLVRGPAARALFNTPEVLVAARDLVNDRTITVDRALREVTYVHILLARHQVIWANGLETESFHPSNTSLQTVDPAQRAELLALYPGLVRDPEDYGGFARRNLTGSEAAILRYEAA